MRAIWNELSERTIGNCWKHKELLKQRDEAASFIDLTESENFNADKDGGCDSRFTAYSYRND